MRDRKNKLTITIFIIYCLILTFFVMFKGGFSVLADGERSINLIPFHYDNDVGRIHTREVVLNLLVFVPMGVYLRMLGAKLGKCLLYGVSVSLGFEICQFALTMGKADITDIISNTFGVAVGIFIYALLRRLFDSKTHKIVNAAALAALALFLCLATVLFIAN